MGKNKMTETKNDIEYKKGVEDGQKGDLLDDIVQGHNPLPSETYNKGYEYGSQNRYDDKGNRYSDNDKK